MKMCLQTSHHKMSASFIISIDSIEFFNLPKSWLKKNEVSSIDTARIKLTLVAGLRRRETFKSNPIPVSSLNLRGFGFNDSMEQQPLPSKLIRLTRDTAISHRFAEVNFTRVQQQQDQGKQEQQQPIFQTSKAIEFELRLYDKQGTERKLSIISQNNFQLSDAIKLGSFPEGVISPKVYFKLDKEEYDGAAVAVLNGSWRRLQSFDSPQWSSSNNQTQNQHEPTNANDSSSKSDRTLNNNINDPHRGVDNSVATMMGDDNRTLSWGAATSRNFAPDHQNPTMYYDNISKARFFALQQQQQKQGLLPPNTNLEACRPRRVVVISGGARGIGATLVKMFLLSGYLVSTCDLLEFDEDELEEIKAEALRRHHCVPSNYSQKKSSKSTRSGSDEMTLEEKQRKVLKIEKDDDNQKEENLLERSKSERLGAAEGDRQDTNKMDQQQSSIDDENEEVPKILHTYRCNITDEEAVKKFIDSTAKYFHEEKYWLSLICNAAIANPYMPSTGTEDSEDKNKNAAASSGSTRTGSSALSRIDIGAFKNYLNVNITGSMILMKHCAKFLEPRKNAPEEVTETTFKEDDPNDEFFGGSIVLISSTRAAMSEPNSESYGASKGAIESLCHSVAISNPRIRCNAIRVGWINALPDYCPSFGDHQFHPAGRVGRPADVFHMCRFLAENELSGFVTGSVMTLDGGVTRKMIYPDE